MIGLKKSTKEKLWLSKKTTNQKKRSGFELNNCLS